MADEWKPSVIVLGPGGVKGFLQLGALAALHSRKMLDSVGTFVGVSVGAILSLLLVAGYDPLHIACAAIQSELFQDIASVDLANVRGHGGLFSNAGVRQRLTELLQEKFGIAPTLEQLYQFTGKTLVAVTHNLTTSEPEYMSRTTEPHMAAVDAVLLSMNIPLLFYRMQYRGCTYIDGAFGDPYPIAQHDDGNTDILGISVETCNTNTKGFWGYIYDILQCPLTQLRKTAIRRASARCKHLLLECEVVDPIGIATNILSRATMFTRGFWTTREFIEGLKIAAP